MKNNAAPLVLGGGPAGSIFALTMARAGREVTLLEKSKAAHDKVCGEFLSRESLLYLEQSGIRLHELGAVPIRNMRLVTPWFQRERALPFPAWSLTRKRLDEALLEQAAAGGVQILRDAHVTSVEEHSGTWSATLRDGRTLRNSNIVLATGKLDISGLHRQLGQHPSLIAFKMYFQLAAQQQSALSQTVELVLYPGGYAGLQPVQNGVVNLCLLIDPRSLNTPGVTWEAVLQYVLDHSPHLQQRLAGAVALLPKPLAASHIPYGHLQRTTANGLWRVGDQAAVIPSFCGDGTAIALHSGALAAFSFLRGDTSMAYQQKLHRQLSTRMWFASQLSRLLLQRPRASELARAFPTLLRTIASLTRIPNSALLTSRSPQASLGGNHDGHRS